MSIYRALKYKNCRLFFPGLLISQIGIWFQNTAISWFLLEIEKSPLIIGYITFINALPLFLLTPFSGVITDKTDKKKFLLFIQILFLLQAVLIATASVSGLLNVKNIIILSIFLNIIIAIDTPLRQSIFASLVDDKKDMTNAIALNSACFNSARLIGPALAGIILLYIGIKHCFLINLLCFIPAVMLVSRININPQEYYCKEDNNILEEFKAGLSYIKGNKTISLILIFLFFISLIGMTYTVLIPMHSKYIFDGEANILGFIMASSGFGSLCASFILAAKNKLSELKNTMLTGVLFFGCSFILIGLSKIFLFSIISAFILGAGMTASITGINTILQSLADDNKRGRLMSFYTICYLGAAAISNLTAGAITQYLGISKTFIIFGSLLIIISFIMYKKLNHKIIQI